MPKIINVENDLRELLRKLKGCGFFAHRVVAQVTSWFAFTVHVEDGQFSAVCVCARARACAVLYSKRSINDLTSKVSKVKILY